ncbi:MAG: hypothetical protein ACMUJM_13070 [bacterium]
MNKSIPFVFIMNKTDKKLETKINDMLGNIFTQADLKSLAKNKGIIVKGIDKSGLVELVVEKFLIPEKIVEVFNDLAPHYQFLLHYLKIHKDPIDLKRAMRYLNNWESAQSRGSFMWLSAKEYRKSFIQLKNDLAVKGLVIIIQSNHYGSYNSQFERYDFLLPPQFSSLLPPLPIQGVKRDKPTTTYSFELFVKDVILSSIGLKNPKHKMEQKIADHISWREGIAHFHDRPIRRIENLLTAIYSTLRARNVHDYSFYKLDVVTNLFYLLETLPTAEWMSFSKMQELFFQLTCLQDTEKREKILHKVCDEAAVMGLMEKSTDEKESYYRLRRKDCRVARGDTADISVHCEGIATEHDGSLCIDHRRISAFALFEILSISAWEISKDALRCSPSLIKCGKIYRARSDFSSLRLYGYLYDNSSLYKRAFSKVEKNFGKFMLHSNLSIFEIQDVTISALLQHTFPEAFHPVRGNFFAVSEKDEMRILNFLEQKKYSIRISDE